MKIDFTTPSGTPAPLPPAHEFYTPTYEWCLRHKLHIDEAEEFVQLFDHEDYNKSTRSIAFSKDTGRLIMGKVADDEIATLFDGYLPNEEALEAVIKYTNWNA